MSDYRQYFSGDFGVVDLKKTPESLAFILVAKK